KIESDRRHHCKADFFNTIGQKRNGKHWWEAGGPLLRKGSAKADSLAHSTSLYSSIGVTLLNR
ncbi:hypothetical protein, partial [Sphingomonas sp. CFBP 13706]|uniref:hypothetical protein n=1 Tax=Sphingomonas sp. CFBP 13706 TaxID=2775314 RepID=UPI001A7ED752